MAIATKRWDAAEVLGTPADIAAYLDAYLEDGTPEELLGALNTIARSKGMPSPTQASRSNTRRPGNRRTH